jgi:hypothetical protein
VCKQHCTGVVNLDTHLLQHHNTDAATRRQIIDRFAHVTTVDPRQVELPEEPARPIEELGAPLGALRCKTCRKVTVNTDAMRKHCKNIHQQAWAGDKSVLYDAVKVQTIFRTGGLQKYFIVEYDEVVHAENMDVERTVEGRLAEFKVTQEIVKKSYKCLMKLLRPTELAGISVQAGWSSSRTEICRIWRISSACPANTNRSLSSLLNLLNLSEWINSHVHYRDTGRMICMQSAVY